VRVPIQDPKRQYHLLKKDIDQCALIALDSGRWFFGEQVNSFETSFARYCGVKRALTVANGTDALEIALVVAGAKGREVITVANAGGYTTTACRIIGAIPVYVDIDPDSLLMSPPAALLAVTPQTAAIVVTHLYGRLADIHALRSGLISRGRQDITIIEDCAQSHGAVRNGHYAGSLGDMGIFSFYPTKNLGAIGDGGAIVCTDDDLARLIVQLRQYGWSERYHSVVPYGRNSRMDEIQAAILCVKLPYLDEWNARRRQIVQRYSEVALRPLSVWFDNSSAFVAHLAIARHPERDRIRNFLQDLGVTTDIHYPIIDCDQPSQQVLPSVVHDLGVTRQVVNEIFTLPCFPEMTDEEVRYVCECLQKME
jgi:dTDP-4-amino-4,6-dideoxygalactose transaminase